MQWLMSAAAAAAIVSGAMYGCNAQTASSGLASNGDGGGGTDGGLASGDDSGGDGGAFGCFVPDASCSVAPQCGCASGQKCDLFSSGASCVTPGTGVTGALCKAPTDCATGLTCQSGLCRPFCGTNDFSCPRADAGPPLGECVQLVDNGTPVPQGRVCTLDCSILPNDCPTGSTCLPFVDNNQTVSDCVVPGTATQGAACTSNRSCAAGLVCASSNGANTCLPWCRVGTAADCTSPATCHAFTAAVFVNGVQYGDCF